MVDNKSLEQLFEDAFFVWTYKKILLGRCLFLTFLCAYDFTEMIVTSVLVYTRVHSRRSEDTAACLVAKSLGGAGLFLTVGGERRSTETV